MWGQAPSLSRSGTHNMATNYPTSLDTYTDTASTESVGAAGGGQGVSVILNNTQDAIEALQAKVGVDSSAVVTSHDYKITALETDVALNTAARHDAVTVSDSSEIDFTLTGQDITASIVAGSIDETKLDASTNASLDLADSATQPGDSITTLDATAHRTFYSDASGNITELAHGTSGQVYTSNGASAAPTWEDASGGVSADGWIDPSETWTYATASTFTISGDVTSIYKPGLKLKFSQPTDGQKYGYVKTATYSAPNTTITLVTNDDYDLDNEAITANYYSRVAQPEGFPVYFNYTPSYSAGGSMTFTSVTTTTAAFSIIEGVCLLSINATGTTGGSASSAIQATLPINSSISSFGSGIMGDTSFLLGPVQTNSTIVSAYKDVNLSNWGLGGSKNIQLTVSYPI